jgi:protein SCO1
MPRSRAKRVASVLDLTIGTVSMSRRHMLGLATAGISTLTLATHAARATWHSQNISGALPSLELSMTDANTGKPVTATDFRGKVVLLYFGYTLCPDFCPTTLTNLANVLDKLGPLADRARVLFVTVDPIRDSLATLKVYAKAFAPQVVGLRGTPDQLAELARRYRVAYSVTPASNGHPYQVTHSSIVFVFDGAGEARLILTSMSSAKPDIDGVASDLRLLIQQTQPGLWQRLLSMV